MADELIIEGLHISSRSTEVHGVSQGQIVVDAIMECDFDDSDDSAAGLSVIEVCLEIERLCEAESFQSLEQAVSTLMDGLMESLPQARGIELTLRCLEPTLSGMRAAAIGVRRRRHSPHPGPWQKVKPVRPRPRPAS